AQRGQDREARGDERRLLHLGLDQLLERRLEAEAAQVEARRLASDLVDLHRLGNGLRDVPPHARLQRPLSGEAERDLAHFPSSVHSSSAEPQVSPAPIPVINTRSPSCNLSSAAASASASGIEPEEVFPYLSTLTTTRSRGMPRRSTAWSMI